MYRYRRPPSRWPRLILLGAVLAALGLASLVLFGVPKVTAFAPEGRHVSVQTPISLTFNMEMDRASVERNLHIEPAISGTFSWSGQTLKFTPSVEWPIGPVRVWLEAGTSNARGLPLLFDTRWEFSIGAPGIAYLAESTGSANIWIASILGGEPTQVTQERIGVDRFGISPDGTYFVYAALRADGGADLKRINRDGSGASSLLDCPANYCTAPAFSPNGLQIAFERHPLDQPDHSTLEVINLNDGQHLVLDNTPTHRSRSPTFAPDGRLAYLNFYNQEIVVFDFATQDSKRIPDNSGEMGDWSPDGQSLIFPEITIQSMPTPAPGTPPPALQLDTYFSHLRRVSVATGLAKNLSGPGAVEDAGAVYSPDGQWLAFGRKVLEQEKWTPGRQLWRMRADGSAAQALTDDPLYNHSNFVWGPDGGLIVYVRFDMTDPASTTEIWLIGANGAQAQQLVSGGYLPKWMP